MSLSRIRNTIATLLFLFINLSSAPSRAEILFNGVAQPSPATIAAGQSIVGSRPAAGVVVNGADDLLTMSGGAVDTSAAGSIGIRALAGTVLMSGGSVRGAEAGVLVNGGTFTFSGGSIRDGIVAQGAGSLFEMSAGTVSNRSVTASAGATIAISGGTIFNSRVQASGATSRVDLNGGDISWLDALDGAEAHVFGTSFSVNGTPVCFAVNYTLPATAAYMAVNYANQTSAGFKLNQTGGGTITLHMRSPGDFDGDSDVDGFDFLKWQRGQVAGAVSLSHLSAWEANFGSVAGASGSTTPIPEPSSWIIMLVALTALRRRA
jgi:hypothetical protein